jgi:hypothetical protein
VGVNITVNVMLANLPPRRDHLLHPRAKKASRSEVQNREVV